MRMYLTESLDYKLRSESINQTLNDDYLQKKGDFEKVLIYVILSYTCNYNCSFCIFKTKQTTEINDEAFTNKFEKIMDTIGKKEYAVSITGGEPFYSPSRLTSILNSINLKSNPNLQYAGLGTNGSLDNK